MVGGSLHEPLLTLAWPTAHLGPMGLEGAVRLALRKELEAIADEDEREQRVRDLTAAAEENAKALNAAALFELDDVIDPAETRGADRRDPARRGRLGAAAGAPLRRRLVAGSAVAPFERLEGPPPAGVERRVADLLEDVARLVVELVADDPAPRSSARGRRGSWRSSDRAAGSATARRPGASTCRAVACAAATPGSARKTISKRSRYGSSDVSARSTGYRPR